MSQEYFHRVLPAPQLRNFIRHYTFVDVPAVKAERMEFCALSACSASIVLFLGEPSRQMAEGQMVQLGPHTLTGLYSRPQLFLPCGPLRQLIIRFTPWGVQPFLDFPLSDITDGRAELRYIFREGLEHLAETLQREGPEGGWKEALDNFFKKHLKTVEVSWRAQKVAQRIFRAHGKVRLSKLAQELCIGERTLQRLVHHSTGVNFKFFAGLAQVQYARRMLREKPHLRLSEAALSAGYCDQAHFTRAFQAACGETPGRFREKRQQMVWNKLEAAS